MVVNNKATQKLYSTAGSMVVEKPAPGRRTDGGNVHLMEARLIELYSSLRALWRSNKDLKEALVVDPGDKDFQEAIEENWSAMRKQRELAMELVAEMKVRGVNVDLPDDICEMDIPPVKKSRRVEEEDHKNNKTRAGGLRVLQLQGGCFI